MNRRASPPAHARLLGRSRWRVATLGALVVAAVLALLSAAAYAAAREVLVAGLYERLELAAAHADRSREATYGLLVDERGRPLGALAVDPDAGGSPSGFHIVHVADLGALALLRLPARGGGPRLLATSAVEEQAALQAFVRVLAALTLAGGLAALPAGYVLAGIALRPLDEAVRERSRFVALASHQLRTPLAVIRTALELAEGGRGLTAAAALRTVGEQARRMERLAERLTALAHAEAGTPAAAPGADLAAAAAREVEGLRPAAAQAGVRLTPELPDRPVWVRASGDELSDVLAVLLENAIRFSAPGSAVRVRAEAAAGHGILSVVDQGRGISPEDLPRVTLPFYQGKPTRGGHGLGLAIARAVVDRRRGRLEIASRPGEGTTVTARFPLLPASRRPPA